MAAKSTRVDLSALAPLLGSEGGDLWRRAQRCFDLMRVTEEEIAAAKARWPRRQKSLHAAFKILYPGELARYAEPLYRAHCRELLGRVMRREDVKPGTDAECLVVFSEASLQAPLTADHAHAMSTVFYRVFPGATLEQAGSEPWPGRTAEILRELRKKLARDRTS